MKIQEILSSIFKKKRDISYLNKLSDRQLRNKLKENQERIKELDDSYLHGEDSYEKLDSKIVELQRENKWINKKLS